MIFCQCSHDWRYRKSCRYWLSQRRRDRKEKRIKRYWHWKKNVTPEFSTPLREKYDFKPPAQAGFPVIQKSTVTVRSGLNFYIFIFYIFIKMYGASPIAVPLKNNMITLNAVVTAILLYWTDVRHEITEQHSCHTRGSGYPASHWIVCALKAAGLWNTSMYFILRTSLRLFKFNPVEFSPAFAGMTSKWDSNGPDPSILLPAVLT